MEYSSTANGIVMAIVGAVVASLVFSVIFTILEYIGRWKINTKAGRTGWHALIPCLSEYTLFDLATGMGWLGIVFFVLSLFRTSTSVSQLTSMMSGNYDFTSATSSAGGMLSNIAGIASFVISIYLAVKLSRAFGKGIGYILLLIFLTPIACMMLGFGSAEYMGIDGEGIDGFGNVNGAGSYAVPPAGASFGNDAYSSQSAPSPDNGPFNDMTPPVAPKVRFCTNCGAELKEGARFCESCGTPSES